MSPTKYINISVIIPLAPASLERRSDNRYIQGFCGCSDGKESACNVGGLGLISGWGRSPGEGNSYPLGYSDLENSMDRGAWWTTVHEATKIWTWLSNLHFHFCDTEFPNVRRKGKPTHGNLQVRPGGIIYHHILPWITQWILCITINYMPCIILK